MTLVQNHLLQLSGNKHWLIAFICIVLAGCSPKVQTTTIKKPQVLKIEKEVEKPASRFTQANISLLVPFRLNDIKLKTASKSEVEKAAMAIDFYQGFKLGVDSAASLGLNFKLNVFDTRDNNARLDELIENGNLSGSNLIVGPVFPDGLKHMKNYALNNNVPIVNPLAATHPDEFANPNLITIVNNINLHAEKLGAYITRHYNPATTVVVLINPKSAEDEVMASPIRAFFAGNKKPFFFQEFASVFTLETKLIKNKKYVILVSSSDRKFVVPTLDKLMKMKNAGLSVDLFGHPDWVKQNYNTDKLQALHTSITSSYKIDYTNSSVNAFIRKYRQAFNFEPGEYAFKGFDIGLYFSKLLAKHGQNYVQYLTKEQYKGLHNTFSFCHDAKLGFINTHLMLLRYQDFALKTIE